MERHKLFLDHLAAIAVNFSALEIVSLLVVVRDELNRRGHVDAANYVTRGALCFAEDLRGPEWPSDNGNRAPGDSGAAG
jgi:hypothetical protein